MIVIFQLELASFFGKIFFIVLIGEEPVNLEVLVQPSTKKFKSK